MAELIETQFSHGKHGIVTSDMVFAVEMGDNSEIEKDCHRSRKVRKQLTNKKIVSKREK